VFFSALTGLCYATGHYLTEYLDRRRMKRCEIKVTQLKQAINSLSMEDDDPNSMRIKALRRKFLLVQGELTILQNR
jgi:hypothetical protein